HLGPGGFLVLVVVVIALELLLAVKCARIFAPLRLPPQHAPGLPPRPHPHPVGGATRRPARGARAARASPALAPSAQAHAPLSRPSSALDAATPGFGSGHDLLRANRPAMGSYFEVRLGAGTPGAVALTEGALDLIDALEQQLTVYRDDSEVSRINADAHLGPV